MSQIGDTRIYTNVDEANRPTKKVCPLCKVYAVPRGINTTRPDSEGEQHCPNCGYTHGRTSLIPNRKLTSVVVAGAGDAVTIATDGGTLQMSATVAPDYADNKTVTWSVVAGTGTATISAEGLLTAVTNGTVIVKATANDEGHVVGEKIITLSNQV